MLTTEPWYWQKTWQYAATAQNQRLYKDFMYDNPSPFGNFKCKGLLWSSYIARCKFKRGTVEGTVHVACPFKGQWST